jgi:hypothetical protein
MNFNKVVVQFKDKTIKKGKTFDFSFNKTIFYMETLDSDILDIPMESVKAVFFVRDFKGDKNRHDRYRDVVPGGGKKIQVKFLDGETIVGFSHGYHEGRHGFFMIPAHLKGNNYRIFVVKSSTEKITRITERTESVQVAVPSFAY